MSRNIEKFLSNYKKKVFLAVFPHADDVAFVSGGLFQLLQKMDIKTKFICLTSGGDKEQLGDSDKVLGVDELEVYSYEPGKLKENTKKWISQVEKEIEKTRPFAILTFDPHGVTGNVDHVECSVGIFNLLKDMKGKRPELLWRISDSQEKRFFDKNNEVTLDIEATFYHFLRLTESVKKLKAIFKHKYKFKTLIFKMRVLEWYLFDHKELYYLVDFSNNKYQIVVS